MPTLKIIKPTIAKQSTAQASTLPPCYRVNLEAGTYSILKIEYAGSKHYKVGFPKPIQSSDKTKSFQTWCIFAEDLEIPGDAETIVGTTGEVKLGMRYRSQRNNELNPDGSCNVTSFAMCLDFLGAKRKESEGQFEDELYRYCENHDLCRHTPEGLKSLAEAYGVKDDFHSDADIEQIKAHLRLGLPAVLQGYFTGFGHVVALNGCNDDGFWVYDPYGEWNIWGYTRNSIWGEDGPGDNIFYSDRLIQDTCDRDGIWAHLLSK
jgi:hypothetical protein